jgi:acetyltransferase-like isoleucine patch superfamily enzyme
MGPGLRAERLPHIRGKGDLSLGTGVYLSGRSSFFFMRGTGDAPEIVISDHTFIGSGCTFSAARSIRVGPHSLISAGVRIHDNDGHPTDAEARRRGDGICGDAMGSVVIDENVWIGAGAVVLKGVRIGRNSIVGSAAVVTRNVPPDTVVAGNPARVVKSLGEVGGTCGHGR